MGRIGSGSPRRISRRSLGDSGGSCAADRKPVGAAGTDFSAITAARDQNSTRIRSRASANARGGITQLSCSENLEVEASVARYSNTLPHVRPVVPEQNCLGSTLEVLRRGPDEDLVDFHRGRSLDGVMTTTF